LHYGLDADAVALLDIPYGKSAPTHADVISYIASTYLPGRKSYLEIGVSAGKTLYQMMNAFSDSSLFGYEIEDITPTLESFLTSKQELSAWTTMHSSPRKAYSSWTYYKFPDSHSEVHYVAADIFDTESWYTLQTRRFDVIFLNGPPNSIYKETEMLLSMNLVNYNRFIIWYGGIDGEKTVSLFFDNVNALKEKRFKWLNKDNVALVQAKGTLGDARRYGIVSTLNISKIIEEDLVE